MANLKLPIFAAILLASMAYAADPEAPITWLKPGTMAILVQDIEVPARASRFHIGNFGPDPHCHNLPDYYPLDHGCTIEVEPTNQARTFPAGTTLTLAELDWSDWSWQATAADGTSLRLLCLRRVDTDDMCGIQPALVSNLASWLEIKDAVRNNHKSK